jgi:hypothetical protein
MGVLKHNAFFRWTGDELLYVDERMMEMPTSRNGFSCCCYFELYIDTSEVWLLQAVPRRHNPINTSAFAMKISVTSRAIQK